MIADALRVQLERYASRMHRDNPLYVTATHQTFTPEIASRYLVNVRHLIRHTPVYLDRARQRALARGEASLAAHYSSKVADEQGHDRWADEDLHRIRERFGIDCGHEIVPALASLLHYLEETIDRDPRLYLAYILFAEQLIALRGAEWLGLVEERCGIPKEMMTVIGNHADLDREHAAEGLEAIDALVTDPAMLTPMRETLTATIDFFERFCTEVVGSAAQDAGKWPASSIA